MHSFVGYWYDCSMGHALNGLSASSDEQCITLGMYTILYIQVSVALCLLSLAHDLQLINDGKVNQREVDRERCTYTKLMQRLSAHSKSTSA